MSRLAPSPDEQAEDKGYAHILKYTGLFGGVQVFNILLSVARNKCAAVLIGSVGMGLSDLYARSAEFVSNATSFGIGFSAVRRLSELFERGDRRAVVLEIALIRTWVFLTALLGLAVGLLLSPLLSRMATGSYADTPSFALLAPMAALATLAAGETAVLKGIHRLKRIAAVSAASAVATLFIAVCGYWALGLRGVLPVLLLGAAVLFGLQLRATIRLYPYRIRPFSRRFLRKGGAMLRLGTAYVAAAVVTSLAEMAVRAFVARTASLSEVGFYAAGVTLTVSYARLVFMAMDADFFPRLAAMSGQTARCNDAINRQTDVCVLLMAPFLMLFALCLPLVVRVLYTSDFLSVVPMVLFAASSMFFKAMYTPPAYLPLAAGHSRRYLLVEGSYGAAFCAAVVVGYERAGLIGAGIGLSLAHLLDLLMVVLVYGRCYGFRFRRATLLRCAALYALLLVALFGASQASLLHRLAAGVPPLLLSAAYAAWFLKRKTRSEALS